MSRNEAGFVKIDRSEIQLGNRGGYGVLGPRVEALLAGDTIWVAGSSSWRSNAGDTLRGKGYRLHCVAHSRDGVAGHAAWAEKL